MARRILLVVLTTLLAGLLYASPAFGQYTCDTPAPTPHASWRQILTPTSPPGRFLHGIAYDEAREVVVIFGGGVSCADRSPRDDTWEFDGTSWHQVTTPHSPPARYHGNLAYDAARQRTVLFGGTNGATPFGDTWEYDGTDWAQVFPTASPGACWSYPVSVDTPQLGIAVSP